MKSWLVTYHNLANDVQASALVTADTGRDAMRKYWQRNVRGKKDLTYITGVRLIHDLA